MVRTGIRAHARTRGVRPRRATGRQLATRIYLRRGEPDDLVIALELDHILDAAQQRGPSFSLFVEHASRPEEMLDTLDDPEVHHYLVDYDGESSPSASPFPSTHAGGPLATRCTSAPWRCVPITSIAASPKRSSVARSTTPSSHGFRYAEANWRVTNHRAAYFWRHFGFRVTYVRLHRTIGAG